MQSAETQASKQPENTPGAMTPLTAQRVRELLDAGGCVVVDVREPDEHAREHIEGTALVPLSRFDTAGLPKGTVVFHCRSGTRSKEAAQKAIADGCAEVCYLEGGIEAWRKAGLPTVKGKGPRMGIMQQVQFSMGVVVLVAAALVLFHSPWWLILHGIIGTGMVHAGLSGTCGMATLLSKMPWNKVPTVSEGCDSGSCTT